MTKPKHRSTSTKAKAKKPGAKSAPRQTLKRGTTLKRTFKGKTYELKVLADGYALDGTVNFIGAAPLARAVEGAVALAAGELPRRRRDHP